MNHPFWTEKDKTVRGEVLEDFLKDVALVGAALLATVDTAGKPGALWRGKRAGKDAKRLARMAAREALHAAEVGKKDLLHAAESGKKDLQLVAAKV